MALSRTFEGCERARQTRTVLEIVAFLEENKVLPSFSGETRIR